MVSSAGSKMHVSSKTAAALPGYLEPALVGHIYLTADEPYYLHMGGNRVLSRQPPGERGPDEELLARPAAEQVRELDVAQEQEGVLQAADGRGQQRAEVRRPG